MKISQKILFLYCAVLAIFFSVSGILHINGIESALFQLAFLPVSLYFLVSTIKYLFQIKKQKSKKAKEDVTLGIGFSSGKGRTTFTVILFLVLLATSARRIFSNHFSLPEQEPSEAQSEGININEYIIEPQKYVLIKSDDNSVEINVREKPSTSSDILGKAIVDEEYEYLSEDGLWYEIKIDESSGWVHKNYAEIVEKIDENSEE